MKLLLDNLLLLQSLELQAKPVAASVSSLEELRKKIPTEILEHFNRLRKRGKKGVAYVKRGVCGQCHMQVAVGLLAALQRYDRLYRCENCGAYLYPVDEPAPLEMPPRATKPGRRGRPRKDVSHVA